MSALRRLLTLSAVEAGVVALICAACWLFAGGERVVAFYAEDKAIETTAAELAAKLAGAKVEKYADGPGYSEGPTYRDGEVFFCSDGLQRVGRDGKVEKYLALSPAGTFLTKSGSILVCDNKSKALLELTPEGRVDVLAESCDGKPLNSLNDVTVDARGNIYWTDPAGSSKKEPVGKIFRLTPQGVVSCIAEGLAFPNGLEVDPASRKLYVIESQTEKILRYDLPADDHKLGAPEDFYLLGGSGGDGCAFDAAGNIWVADFHRPETKHGRIVVLSPAKELLATLEIPAEAVSNITFGGPNRDEIFCTTGGPPGVFHAKVGVVGFAGHPGSVVRVVRRMDAVEYEPSKNP